MIHQASLTLTDAQTRSLGTGAIEIIPTPGITRVLIPVLTLLVLDWAQDFGNISGTASLFMGDISALSYLDEANANPSVKVSVLLASGQSQIFQLTSQEVPQDLAGLLGTVLSPLASVTDHNFYIQADNGGADFTNGNGSTLTVDTIFYVYDAILHRFLTTTESGWDQSTRTF